MSPIRRSVARCHERLDILIMGCESTNVRKKKNVTGNWNDSGKGPVVRSHYRANRVVPEPFHCDHIARWSAHSGTTGRSGTSGNTGSRFRTGPVSVSKLWCEHGLVKRCININCLRIINFQKWPVTNCAERTRPPRGLITIPLRRLFESMSLGLTIRRFYTQGRSEENSIICS